MEKLCAQVSRRVQVAMRVRTFSRKGSEACGPSAADHSPRGCSTGASGAGSARCERWPRLDSNRVHAPTSVEPSIDVRCGRWH